MTVGRKYPIEFARRVNTKYGDTALLSLRDTESKLVKVFLPKRYSTTFKDEDLEMIVEGKLKLHLIYKGKCDKSGSYQLVIE